MEDLRELKKGRRELDKRLRRILGHINVYDFEKTKWRVLAEINALTDECVGREVYDLLDSRGEELFLDLETRLEDLIHSDEVDYEATGFWWSINELKNTVRWVR